MTDKEKNKIELSEIERLTKEGFSFKVEYDVTKHTIFGAKKRHVSKEYNIEEPTLGTLDRMTKEWLKMDIQEGGDSMNTAKVAASQHALRMCRVVAIAVVGSEYGKNVSKYGWGARKSEEKRIDELAEIFAKCIRPSDLKKISYFILASANLVDFFAAITMMRAQRTTKPSVVAEERKA